MKWSKRAARLAFIALIIMATSTAGANGQTSQGALRGPVGDAHGAFPRVRPLSARLARLLERGYARSPAFAKIVDDLERSDVIVHIVQEWQFAGGEAAHTRFIVSAGGQRYLRISILTLLSGDTAVALLGHELCHARELAQAPWVTSDDAMATLYGHIGHRSGNAGTARGFDTVLAHQVERQVRSDVRLAPLKGD